MNHSAASDKSDVPPAALDLDSSGRPSERVLSDERLAPTTPPVVATGRLDTYAALLDRLVIPFVEAPEKNAFVLVENDGRLDLRPPGETERTGIRACFPPDADRGASGPRSPLAKAFGKRIKTVLDLTMGLGVDAYRLAESGYVVRGWERHPAVFALVLSGWEAALALGDVPSGLEERLSLSWGDASLALPEFESGNLGAYFDPMYPVPRKGSALPKRPLQVLRRLLGPEEEPVELVSLACERLARVVVKRPHHAPPLVLGPTHSIETKQVRLDVYLNPARMESGEE